MIVADSGDSGISSSSVAGEDSVVVDGGDTKPKNLTSPWVQVVRGENTDSIEPGSRSPSPPSAAAEQTCLEGSEGNNGNAGKEKKPAWSKVAAADGEAIEGITSVMGLPSWPDLSESTKPLPKALVIESSPSSKALYDGSTVDSQAPVIPHSPHKQATGSTKTNANHGKRHPSRQQSFRRGGGSSSGNSGVGVSRSSGFSRPPPPPLSPPPFPVHPMASNGYHGMLPPIMDQSPYSGNTWEPRPVGWFIPPQFMGNGHGNSYRRGRGFRSRGDDSHGNNFEGRHDQDWGHYGNGRGRARGFVRPSPGNGGTFIPHQPMVPYMNPMAYRGPYMVYVPMPFVPPPSAAAMTPQPAAFVPDLLVRQVEYYFSDANLITDEYLKSKMNDEGWVPISVIADFKRVKGMTNDSQLILDCLRASNVIEILDDKIRRRKDWERWIVNRGQPGSGLQSDASSSSQTQSEGRKDVV